MGRIRSYSYLGRKNDAYWCKNKRKATLEVGFGFDVIILDNDPRFGEIHQVIVKRKGEVNAWRKGIPCIWYKYKTWITWNNFYTDYDVNLSGVIKHEIWKHDDEKKYAKDIDRTVDYYVYYVEFGQYFDCQWNKIKSDVTTQGIDPKWIHAIYPN